MSESYYGRPIVKPHVWQWYISAYFWIGGTAGAAGAACLAARLRGEDRLADVFKAAALTGAVVSPVLLIADLGEPRRFLNMLRVFKPTSPMNIGSWILSAFGGAVGLSVAAQLAGMKRTARALEGLAAVLGPMLTVYTAVLVADTATPIWHEARATLPFVFSASGIAGAGAVGVAFAPSNQQRLPRRLMIGGALALVLAGQVMERRLGPLLAEPYRIGRGGKLKAASAALALGGAAVATFFRTHRGAARLAALAVASAGILERFAVTAAGHQSALDPKYIVEFQRAMMPAPDAVSQ